MQTSQNNLVLRLIFPQWQGGVNPPYYLGAQLLNWLAPEPNGPVEEVEVALPKGQTLEAESGIVALSQLLQQQEDARRKIDKHRPDSIVIFGGDCLVDLAPFAYLNERYQGELAVLWVDAHPDILSSEQFSHAHAMVLGCLLGQGEKAFAHLVKKPIKPGNLCYVGVNNPSEWEAGAMASLHLQNVSPEEIQAKGSQPVLDWFASTGAKYLAIHFDLDALDPQKFRSVLFAQPDAPADAFEGIAQGKLTIKEVVTIIKDISQASEVVGLGIAEHLPWDALALKEMLCQLPLVGNK